jgi:hypothetical protein
MLAEKRIVPLLFASISVAFEYCRDFLEETPERRACSGN